MSVVKNIGYHLTPEASVVKRKKRVQGMNFNMDLLERKEEKNAEKYKGHKRTKENNDTSLSKIDIYI